MQRSLVSSPLHKSAFAFALFVLVTQLAVACGGSADKPPLTPDDPSLTAIDAGDVPSTPAPPSAAPPAN